MPYAASERFIIHIDMDAFFASVEQRDNPSLKNKPVIVGSDPKQGKGRGVVAACSYEARKYGIHSAMPISQAYKKCPGAVFLPVDMDRYLKVSEKIFNIINDFSPKVQVVSVDEAFIDISGSWHLFGTPEDAARRLKERIKTETLLNASVGLAPNKFLAKLASEHKKPDGFFVVRPEEIKCFLETLSIDKIYGIGGKTAELFKSIGIHNVKDLAGLSADKLVEKFGKSGLRFYNLARGVDNSEVEAAGIVKSVSNEYTFEKDISKNETAEAVLLKLSDKVAGRLRKKSLAGRNVSVKIRLENFKTYTRTKQPGGKVNTVEEIYSAARSLFRDFRRSHKSKKIRLLGVKVDNFKDKKEQLKLFAEENSQEHKKNIRLDNAVDKIRNKYGDGLIYRAGTEIRDE